MHKLLIIVGILALNLSSSAVEARRYGPGYVVALCCPALEHHAMAPGGPLSGARRMEVSMEKEWPESAAPVPYYDYWNNPLQQTAQQYVAILAMLQQEREERDRKVADLFRKIEETEREEAENRRRATLVQSASEVDPIALVLAITSILSLMFIFAWYTDRARKQRNQSS